MRKSFWSFHLSAAIFFSALFSSSSSADAQTSASSTNPLRRHYTEGQTLVYHMKGINESWHYEIDAHSVVKKTPQAASSKRSNGPA